MSDQDKKVGFWPPAQLARIYARQLQDAVAAQAPNDGDAVGASVSVDSNALLLVLGHLEHLQAVIERCEKALKPFAAEAENLHLFDAPGELAGREVRVGDFQQALAAHLTTLEFTYAPSTSTAGQG